MRKPCCYTNNGASSKQHHDLIIDSVSTHGEPRCRSLPTPAATTAGLHTGRFRTDIIKCPTFDQDEEDLILKLHALLGNRWSLIAGRLPGRTGNEVKNYWNSQIRRKLMKKGIDPNNHRMYHIRTNAHVRGGDTSVKDAATRSRSMEEDKSGGSTLDLNVDLAIINESESTHAAETNLFTPTTLLLFA